MEVKGYSGMLELDCPRFVTPQERCTIQKAEDVFEEKVQWTRDKDEKKQLKEVVKTLRIARVNSAELEYFRYKLKFQAILSFANVGIMKQCQQALKPQFVKHTAIVSISMPASAMNRYETTSKAEMWFSLRQTATTNAEQRLAFSRGEALFKHAREMHATIEKTDYIAGMLKTIFSFEDSSERDSFAETVKGVVAEAKAKVYKRI